MKSHALLRTNTGLTTNAKLVVSSDGNLYFDCIDSRPELNDVKYRKYQFNKDNYIDEIIPHFFKNTPPEIAFSVKYDNDNDVMFDDFSKQYDDLYYYGARNIADNKDYKEEFEYFAPLHVSKTNIPKCFIIFRIDGPGILELHKDNFRSEILDKLKIVKFFDLSPKTDLGFFLKNNILDNKSFPVSPLEIDFGRLDFSYFVGIDYETGGYSRRAQMMETIFSKEMTFYDMEKFIYDGFQTNRIIYPHLINFSFLFDDTPATPTSLRKWSINRYLGFYFNNIEFIQSIIPNELPQILSDVQITEGNVLTSNTGDPFIDSSKFDLFPYIEIGGNIYKVQKYTQFIGTKRVRVRTGTNTYEDRVVPIETTKYKILSETSLVGKESLINKNIVHIVTSENRNVIYLQDKVTPFTIQNWDDCDMWIIQIGEDYYKLHKNSDGLIEIFTDHAFLQSGEKLEIYTNNGVDGFKTTYSLKIDTDSEPIQLRIFKCEFTDIKDWDTDIVETDFARYEYEEESLITDTDEEKFYLTNLNSTATPKSIDDYKFGNEVVFIPASSEYTANHELFRLVENDLNELWRKNPVRVKWGFQNSISDCDYPYLLNNSLLAGDFNKTVNPYFRYVQRVEKNLDYFYTIGDGKRGDNGTRYSFHSLNIDPSFVDTAKFDFFKYLSSDLDYFSYFFGMKSIFNNGRIIKNTKKWSEFNHSDDFNTNQTLFRGLKFKIYEVGGVSTDEIKVENFNLKTTNEFDGYKFSILFSENSASVEMDTENRNEGVTQSVYNGLRWAIIDKWKMDKTYKVGEIVIWIDYVYRCINQHKTTNPRKNPSTDLTNWEIYKNTTFAERGLVFLPDQQETMKFGIPTSVYYVNDTWFFKGGGSTWQTPFYDPLINTGPGIFNYRGKFVYNNLNISAGDQIRPDSGKLLVTRNIVDGVAVYEYTKYWELVPDQKRGSVIPKERDQDGNSIILNPKKDPFSIRKVPLWNTKTTNSSNSSLSTVLPIAIYYNLCLYDDVLYGATSLSPDIFGATFAAVPPPQNPEWKRIYSFEPDTTYKYGPQVSQNNVIKLNNRYYLCLSSPSILSDLYNQGLDPNDIDLIDYTLDNGICVYINKKHKNILINIYVNDHTYEENIRLETDPITDGYLILPDDDGIRIKGIDRDEIYNDLFEKLSANNFMNALSDLSNKYDFVNAVRYVIVETTGEVKVYDFNDLSSGKNLPYLITCEGPDEFKVQKNSLVKKSVNVDPNLVKPKFKLDDGYIKSLEEINYLGDVPLANIIEDEKNERPIIPNAAGLKNENFVKMFRHSGFYSPIFKNIELFTAYTNEKNLGNFKFDTSLTDFGMSPERIISKINRKESILKLNKISTLKSIYPMIDEFGYHVVKSFIFKSTWDFKFHHEVKVRVVTEQTQNKILQKGQKPPSKNLL